MEALDADPKISALVLTGSEKAFAAGADIKEMAPKSYMVRLSSAFVPGDAINIGVQSIL